MTKTKNSKPDYQVANEAAKALFDTLGIQTTIAAPLPDVRDEWPNILYNVTFSKDGKNLVTQYRLGVGHVDWNCGLHNIRGDIATTVLTRKKNPGCKFKNLSVEATAAAYLAQVQKVQPAAHEVLAAICDDGYGAHSESFDNWAGNFGYDSDSIKARRTYDECSEIYRKAVALIGAANVAKLAELHCQF